MLFTFDELNLLQIIIFILKCIVQYAFRYITLYILALYYNTNIEQKRYTYNAIKINLSYVYQLHNSAIIMLLLFLLDMSIIEMSTLSSNRHAI